MCGEPAALEPHSRCRGGHGAGGDFVVGCATQIPGYDPAIGIGGATGCRAASSVVFPISGLPALVLTGHALRGRSWERNPGPAHELGVHRGGGGGVEERRAQDRPDACAEQIATRDGQAVAAWRAPMGVELRGGRQRHIVAAVVPGAGCGASPRGGVCWPLGSWPTGGADRSLPPRRRLPGCRHRGDGSSAQCQRKYHRQRGGRLGSKPANRGQR
mmetsp:Transcript_22931/g.66306  ORF Transcript_22931/g.66306 Transcript_22931/m.66306 type:complete len:215 (+) Transcript_22931:524-1168(+)